MMAILVCAFIAGCGTFKPINIGIGEISEVKQITTNTTVVANDNGIPAAAIKVTLDTDRVTEMMNSYTEEHLNGVFPDEWISTNSGINSGWLILNAEVE